MLYALVHLSCAIVFVCVCVFRTLSSLTVEETVGTVYLTVARSNGLDSAVSVEFETNSDTAFGMSKIIILTSTCFLKAYVAPQFKFWPRNYCNEYVLHSDVLRKINTESLYSNKVCTDLTGGDYSQLAVYQRFRDTWPLGWCSVFNGDSSLILMLMHDLVTLYRWQGVFVSIQVCDL